MQVLVVRKNIQLHCRVIDKPHSIYDWILKYLQYISEPMHAYERRVHRKISSSFLFCLIYFQDFKENQQIIELWYTLYKTDNGRACNY